MELCASYFRYLIRQTVSKADLINNVLIIIMSNQNIIYIIFVQKFKELEAQVK